MSCSTERKKKCFTITNVPLKKLDESGRKRNKKWADQDHEFQDRPMKLWLHDNGTENEGKSVAAERFTRILKNQIYKNMIVVSKNGYIVKQQANITKHITGQLK